MKDKAKGTDEGPLNDAGTAVETPAEVWFTVTKNAAIIGESHHAKGKRMKLPKPIADECVRQGLGEIDGVA